MCCIITSCGCQSLQQSLLEATAEPHTQAFSLRVLCYHFDAFETIHSGSTASLLKGFPGLNDQAPEFPFKRHASMQLHSGPCPRLIKSNVALPLSINVSVKAVCARDTMQRRSPRWSGKLSVHAVITAVLREHNRFGASARPARVMLELPASATSSSSPGL